MAIRDDFAPGEVLAAADLNDTFASKVPFSYGTATPSTTVEGFIWFDENDTPPSAKVWDGSDFVTFSGAGNADFSDAATGTYTDGGIDYKYITFTGSGTLTVTEAGLADVLVVGGGGGGGETGGAGGGGAVTQGQVFLFDGAYSIVIGGGGSSATGGANGGTGSFSSVYLTDKSPLVSFGGNGGLGFFSGGANGTGGYPNGVTGGLTGISSSITGSAVTYAVRSGGNDKGASGLGTASTSQPGNAGTVIIRVRTN
jgi:hypothetical protein